ncbi:MAG: hypothetical protein IJG42_08175 [Muribaculaceae bacterium]|nr:hypothetical protein [Muribaculaceae bacterium]
MMMKKYGILCLLLVALAIGARANVIVDDFSANVYAWNEGEIDGDIGAIAIINGQLDIKSKHDEMALKTHCYAPINVEKDFRVTAHVYIDRLKNDKQVGLLFNYRDDGNFYCFSFNEYAVSFRRYENNVEVGSYHQGIKWKKKKKLEQEWTLIKEADELAFLVDGQEIIRIRYMPLQYCGIGFYTISKQRLIVDKIEYEQ